MGGAVIKSLEDLLSESEKLIILISSSGFDTAISSRFESLMKSINDILNDEGRVLLKNESEKILLLQERLKMLSNLLRENMDSVINELNNKNKELEYLNYAKKMLLE